MGSIIEEEWWHTVSACFPFTFWPWNMWFCFTIWFLNGVLPWHIPPKQWEKTKQTFFLLYKLIISGVIIMAEIYMDSFLYFNITNMKKLNQVMPEENYLILGSDTLEIRAKGPRWGHQAITLGEFLSIPVFRVILMYFWTPNALKI